MDEIIRIIWTAALSFIAMAIMAKIMGKKQLVQLGFIDYVVGISVGSIAAQMAVDPDIPFYHFLIALLIYLILDIILNYLTRKNMLLKKSIKGQPLILIENGKLNYENLKKSKLDINDLLSLCRIKDCFDLNDISFCIFETSGDLSILLKSQALTVTCKDLKIENQPTELSTEFIEDGKVVEKALEQQNKTLDWLYAKVDAKCEKDIQKIALALYDSKNDKVKVHYKNNVNKS